MCIVLEYQRQGRKQKEDNLVSGKYGHQERGMGQVSLGGRRVSHVVQRYTHNNKGLSTNYQTGFVPGSRKWVK